MCKNKKETLSIIQIMNMFPDNDTAENWFINQRWGNQVTCAFCNSTKVSQRKSAWHLTMRLREAYMNTKSKKLEGIVEVNETYVDGKEKNRHASKRGQGTQGQSTKTKICYWL